jgi:CubicO group peptidase (beta-lactamase class C family)
MPKRPIPTWLLVLLAPVGLLLLIPALWIFSSFTATPVHPNPESVPTVMHTAPLPEWASAVEQARRIVRASVAEQNLPGLSVAAGVDGEIVWAEGFGFADLHNSVPVTPEHRFRIGTASTALTSAAAGLLLENGRLVLDDDIQTYVPEFAKEQQPVTLRELMGHTRGLTPDDGDEAPLFTQHCERPAEAVQYFENWLYFDPGTDGRYSIYDWILVSAAIETAANQPFLTFMREQIFDPLGMRDTAADAGPDPAVLAGEDFPLFILVRELIYDPGATRDTNADSTKGPPGQDEVTPYSTRFRSDPNYGMHVARPLDYSCYAGSSAFLSTPSDLVRFGMAMRSGKLLKPTTVELLQTSQRRDSGEDTGYGLGWELGTVIVAGQPTPAIGHNGESQGGRVASLMTFPEYGIVVAVTSNIPFADTSSLAEKIAQAFAVPGDSPARK